MLETSEGVKQFRPNEALAYLVDEHLQYMRIDRKERWKFQYVELLHDFLRDGGKPDGKQWSEDRIRNEIERASELIMRFQTACQRNDKYSDPPLGTPECYRVIWKHRDLTRAFREGYTSKEACPMDRDSISELAAEYAQQEMRSPKFEVLLVDALVAMEVYAYGEELKMNPSRYMRRFTFDQIARHMSDFRAYEKAKGNFDKLAWEWMKTTIKRALIRAVFLYAIPIGAAWYAAANDWSGTAFAAVSFVGVVLSYRVLSWLWRKLQSLFRAAAKGPLEKAFELHNNMVLAYEELRGGTSSSPRRVREVVARVGHEGAVWDPSVFSVLDVAIARSAGNWG